MTRLEAKRRARSRRSEARGGRLARLAPLAAVVVLVPLVVAAGYWLLTAGPGAGKPSEPFRLALAKHQELVAAYQYDCFARPEYEEVATLLAGVKQGQPEFPEAQAMLRRYAEQKERILASEALAAKEAEAQVQAAAAMRTGFDTAAEYYKTKRGAGGTGGAGKKDEDRSASASTPLGPGGYVVVARDDGKGQRASQAPIQETAAGGSPEPTPSEPPEVDPETLRQRRIDAAAAWKCYASSYGSPRADGNTRHKIRLGETPELKIAGIRVKTLADLRRAIREGAGPGRERDEVLTLLHPYPEESLAAAEARFNPVAFLLITQTTEGYKEIDFLAEYDRCYSTARYKDADRNPPGGPLAEPGKAQTFDLSFPGFLPYSFSIRMAGRANGVEIALDCRTRHGSVEVCRFTLPQMAGGLPPATGAR